MTYTNSSFKTRTHIKPIYTLFSTQKREDDEKKNEAGEELKESKARKIKGVSGELE